MPLPELSVVCRLMLAPALLGAAVQAAAQPAAPLDPVLVTASRSEDSVQTVLAAAVVIDRARIEASQALDLPELLRREVGIELTRSGGPGAQTGLFLRGANTNQTLVLVDGVRIASATTGVAALEHLAVEQIERIEIVRGPRAAVWGSDAIGGVIQIFTRTPRQAELSVSAGRYGDRAGSLAFGTEGGDWQAGAALGRRSRTGYSAQNASGFAFDPDNDGYRASDAHVAADWHGEAASLHLRAQGRDGDIDFDQGRSDSRNRSLSLQARAALGAWQTEAVLGWARDDFRTPVFASRFDTTRRSLDLLARRDGGRQELTLVAGLLDERGRNADLSGANAVFDEDRKAWSAAALYRLDLQAQRLEAALRVDDYDGFGSEWSPRLGWSWQAGSTLRLLASAGEGFRAPNFNELYSPGFGGQFAGNPALEPERSRGRELRAEWRPVGNGGLALTAYRNDVRDLIDFAGTDFAAINVRRARLEGIELEGDWRHGDFSLRGSMAWQDPRDLDADRLLIRRAKRNAHLDLGWQATADWMLGVEFDHASERLDFGGPLDSYPLLALRADWRITPAWRLQLRLDNVTDEDYALARGFNTAGRSLAVRLGWRATP